MQNFEFYNPTRLIFGRGEIARLSSLIPQGATVLVCFGGGSVKRNGVYEQVSQALRTVAHIEFWGIEPNPTVETIRDAIDLAKKQSVTFVLAVGGGSVLDAAKLIAASLYSQESRDPWEIVISRHVNGSLPYGAVLTLPATGSEMNRNSVISSRETQEKLAFVTNLYPSFSVLDPMVCYSLPHYQVACSLADITAHILEQYLTFPRQSRPMDRWAEGLLLTIIELVSELKKPHPDYDAMADYMLTATLALNGMIAMGVSQDWATHAIGHEITALTGLSHGATLAIVYPGLLRTLREQKKDKILQMGARVFGITQGEEDVRLEASINALESLFESMDLPTRLSTAAIQMPLDELTAKIVKRFEQRGTAVGEARNINAQLVAQILESCR